MEKIDQEVMSLLEQAPSPGLEFIDILARTGKDSEVIYGSLNRLQGQGFASFSDRFYAATSESENNATFKAKCPICKTIKVVSNPKQMIVYCPNPDCKTKSGNPRTFWILKRRVKEGVLIEKRLNIEL